MIPAVAALIELGQNPAGPQHPAWRQLGEFFAAFAEPQRLVLIARLAGSAEPLTVTDASTCCGVHLSGVSRHLAILRQAGLVRAEKSGRQVRYALCRHETAAALAMWAEWLQSGGNCKAGECCPPSAANRPLPEEKP